MDSNMVIYVVAALVALVVIPRLNLGNIGTMIQGIITKLQPQGAPAPTDKAALVKELADLLLPLLTARMSTGQIELPQPQTLVSDTGDGITFEHPALKVKISK